MLPAHEPIYTVFVLSHKKRHFVNFNFILSKRNFIVPSDEVYGDADSRKRGRSQSSQYHANGSEWDSLLYILLFVTY
jgi:hypothetical protein